MITEEDYNKMIDFLNSEECMEYLEEMARREAFDDMIDNKYIEKLHSLSRNERHHIIDNIITKYKSKDYYKRELSKGRESVGPLYFLLYKYAEKYGKKISDEIDNCLFYSLPVYVIDDKYVVQKMYGQGTACWLSTMEEYKES